MEKFKKLLQNTNKKNFLDIGTGAGNFIHFIKEVYDGYESIIGIDQDKRIIEVANKRNEDDKISFQEMDASHLTFKDNSFDVVCLSNSLHHLKDVEGILREMKRVCKKDGFIIINEMLNNDLDVMQLSHLKLHHFSAKIDRLLGDTHYETFSKDEILFMVEENTELYVSDAWELDVPRRTENSEEELKYISSLMDRVMVRVPEEHKDEFQLEANEIKEYINQNGYDGCTSLMVVLSK